MHHMRVLMLVATLALVIVCLGLVACGYSSSPNNGAPAPTSTSGGY